MAWNWGKFPTMGAMGAYSPYKEGKYLNKIPGMEHDAYDPYITQGKEAGGIMGDQYGEMSQDPSGLINRLMQNYKQSEGFQFKRDQALKAAGNSAAAGGMRGSALDVGNQVDLENRLQSQDMQEWLQNVLGVQQQGLQGEQHLFDTGYDATKTMTGDISNVYGMKEQQGMLQNQQYRDMLIQALKAMASAG
jgi:hypothetical protein